MLPNLRVLSIVMLVGWSLAHADTCSAPSTTAFHSNDGSITVRIDPGSIRGPGFKNVECFATLTKWNEDERGYHFLRRITLRNSERPLEAVITNDARFLVTFDDWCRMGRTENAIVIYDLQNGTAHPHALKDFLPTSYYESIMSSMSSISSTEWRDEPYVNESNQTVYVPPSRAMNVPGAEIEIDPAKNKISVKIPEK